MTHSRQRIGRRLPAAAFAFVLSFALAATPGGACAGDVEGVEIPEAIEVGGERLVLNGSGVRTVYIVKAYVAALYVREPSAQSRTLLAQAGPRRLSITMLADLSADWIAEHLVEAMRANHSAERFERMEARVQRLIDTLLTLGQTRKGERIDIDAVGGATLVSVDGHPLGPAVPGDDLFDAVLRVFVGERPLDAALKRELLGR